MISPPSDDVVVDVEKGIVALPLGRPPTPRTIDFTLHGLVWRTRCYWDQSKRNVVFNLTCSPENYSTFWTVKSKVEIFLKLKHEEALPSSVEHLFDVSAKGIQMTCTAENLSLDVVRGWTGHGTIPPWFIEIRLIVKIGILSMHGQSIRTMTPPIDFSKPNNNSDRVFVIEGKHLHVNSQVLGVFSTFFDRLFNGEFSDAAKEVIPLDGINYEEFVELLQTIYPSQNSIRVGNVESLLALSDRFDIPSVFIKCEQFLLNSSDANKIDLFLRLDWASRYCMPELQNHLLLSLTTMDAICKASESPAWRNMCEAAKTGLLLTVFRVHKGPNAMPPHFF